MWQFLVGVHPDKDIFFDQAKQHIGFPAQEHEFFLLVYTKHVSCYLSNSKLHYMC